MRLIPRLMLLIVCMVAQHAFAQSADQCVSRVSDYQLKNICAFAINVIWVTRDPAAGGLCSLRAPCGQGFDAHQVQSVSLPRGARYGACRAPANPVPDADGASFSCPDSRNDDSDDAARGVLKQCRASPPNSCHKSECDADLYCQNVLTCEKFGGEWADDRCAH